MKKQILLFILLIFGAHSFAQKKAISKIIKVNTKEVALKSTKQTTGAKVVTIPDKYVEIKKLLDNGEISIDDAYNAQVKIFNEIARGTFNKRFGHEKLNQVIFPVEIPFLFNFYDRSLSIVLSRGVRDSNKVVEIYPKISLFKIDKIQIIKKALGDIEFVMINPHEKNEYVSIENGIPKSSESQVVV